MASDLPPLPAYTAPAAASAAESSDDESVDAIPYILDAEGNPTVRKDYRTTAEQFRIKSKANVGAMRNLFKIASKVWALPEGQKIIVDGEEWSRRTVQSEIALLAAAMEDMHKHFTASMKIKRSTRKGGASKPKSLFYISAQMVNYFREANYGNGLASAFAGAGDEFVDINGAAPGTLGRLAAAGWTESKILSTLQAAENADAAKAGRAPERVDRSMIESIDVTKSMDLVLNKGMATAPILIILLALITAVNKLKSNANGQRNHYDATMLKHFGPINSETKQRNTTRWILNRGGELVDVTPSTVPDSVATKDRAAFAAKLADINMSSFDRLQRHVSKPKADGSEVCPAGYSRIKRAGVGNVCVPCFVAFDEKQHDAVNDDWGILHSMYMVMTAHFHVPDELLTAEERAAIKSVPGADGAETNENIIAAAELQTWIQNLLALHRDRAEPENKKKRTAKRQQASAASKAKKAPAKKGGAASLPVADLPPLP